MVQKTVQCSSATQQRGLVLSHRAQPWQGSIPYIGMQHISAVCYVGDEAALALCADYVFFFYHHLYYHYGGHMARRDTVPGRGCLSSCRRHRRSSSLPQARNLNQETPSSMWQEPLTSFVSFSSIYSAIKMPAFRTPREECVQSPLEAWFVPLDCYLSRHWSCGLPRGSAQACSEAIHYSGAALWSGESHLHDLATFFDLHWHSNIMSLCFTGGESLQGKELPHHERPRKDAQRFGLSSTLSLIPSTLPRHHMFTLRVWLLILWFCFCFVLFSKVCFRSGDWCSFCCHQRFAGPFQGS